MPKSFPVEENHDKDTKDARKQKRQLQTTFTGDSSDTDLGKTQKSVSEVEPGTSGVGERKCGVSELKLVDKFIVVYFSVSCLKIGFTLKT